jgi:peptidoglycan/xylan/chitin deacetylase (PgdA/CDA1 family)
LSDIHDPDNWDGWEAWDSEITVDEETSMTGTASLRVEADTDSPRVASIYRFASPQDFSGRYPVCGLRWMSDTGGRELDNRSLNIHLMDDRDRTVDFTHWCLMQFVREGAWQRIAPTLNANSVDPEFDFGAVVQIDVYHYTGGEYAAGFWIDDIRFPRSDRERGAVMIQFDDSSPTVYETAYPIMERHGIPGTFNVISRRVGPDGSVSVQQLDEMADDGWTIAAHPQYERSLPSMDGEEIQRVIRRETRFLDEHGFDSTVMAWPYNEWSARSVEIASEYIDLAFGGGNGPHVNPPAPGTELVYPRVNDKSGPDGKTSLPWNAIEQAIERDGLACLTFHRVNEERTSESVFEDLIERISSSPLDVLTPADLL